MPAEGKPKARPVAWLRLAGESRWNVPAEVTFLEEFPTYTV